MVCFLENLFGWWDSDDGNTTSSNSKPSMITTEESSIEPHPVYEEARKSLRSPTNINGDDEPSSPKDIETEYRILQQKYEDLLIFCNQLRAEKDNLRSRMKETLDTWRSERDQQARQVEEERLRKALMDELNTMASVVNAGGHAALESFHSAKNWKFCALELNNEEDPGEDTYSSYFEISEREDMDQSSRSLLILHEAELYQAKKKEGFKDKGLYKTMETMVQTRQQLKKVDPDQRRRERMMEIRAKHREKTAGSLQITESKLANTISSLRRVQVEKSDAIENIDCML